MDPLSITASVITVASLATKTCSAFKILRDVCNVLPGRLHALNNEVADFEAVCRQVIDTLDDRESAKLAAETDSSIRQLILQATQALHELQHLLTAIIAKTKRSKLLAANAWRKEQAHLEELQLRIKDIKTSLNLWIGASHSNDITRIRLELQTITTVTSQSVHHQSGLHDEIRNSLLSHQDNISDSMSEMLARMEEMLNEQSDRLQRQQENQLTPLYGRPPPPYRRRSSGTRSPLTPGLPRDTRADCVAFRVAQYSATCRPGCICTCHSQKKSYTPAALERVVGKLFFGYAGLPLLSPKCNSTTCEKAQPARLSVEYWFPVSFVSQIVRFQLAFENYGPQIALSFIRRVPDTAQSVGFAQAGNIEGLKDLFKRDLASPRDVSSTRGYSLLRWAIYAKQWKTAKFLVHAGADTDYRPIAASDNSPRNKACDFVLQGFLSKEAEEMLLCLTSGGDWIEEQNFTILHRITTGLSGASLEKEVLYNLDKIDALDTLGRTPLIWAAARGHSQHVALLLAHGADPNVLDVQWTGAVSYAAERSHLTCVRLLLEAGAAPDPILPKGIMIGSALNCAARNGFDPLVLKTLLDFGADTEASGIDKTTALIHAARTDNVNFTMLLLEYHANINAATTTGQTPLTTAITFNSHRVLRLLLDRWYDYSTCPRLQGPHLLRAAALFGDLETIKILAATNHFRLKYDKSYVLADCLEKYSERYDATEESIAAFRNLLDLLNEDPNTMKQVDSQLESGLLGQEMHEKKEFVEWFDNNTGADTDSDGCWEDAEERVGSSSPSTKEHCPLVDLS